jgi:SPOR domain
VHPPQKKKALPWIWIPVVICLGLLVAAGYVGARILTSRPHAAEQAAAVIPPRKPPAAPDQPAPQAPAEIAPVAPLVDKPAPVAASPAPAAVPPDPAVPPDSEPAVANPGDWGLITPKPGEQYIQISALNTAAAHRYVEQLRHGPLEPHLAPGPREGILRVLIGPFQDRTLLLGTRSDLLSAGIDCFIREY